MAGNAVGLTPNSQHMCRRDVPAPGPRRSERARGRRVCVCMNTRRNRLQTERVGNKRRDRYGKQASKLKDLESDCDDHVTCREEREEGVRLDEIR